MSRLKRARGAILVPMLAILLSGTVACSSSPEPSRPQAEASDAGSSPPGIPLSELEGHILFARAGGRFGEETLFTVNADGSDEKQIFKKTCCPRWFPQGTTVSLAHLDAEGKRVSTGIVNANGKHLKILPLPPGGLNLGCAAAWSHDGLMACEGWNDEHHAEDGIYVRRPDGSGTRRVTHAPSGFHDIPADFSPDGRQIVFIRQPLEFDHPTGPLFIVNVDGSGLHRITRDSYASYTARFSPDGKWIAFTGEFWSSPGSPMWVVHPDGSGLKKIFEDKEGRSAATPTWSPDGSMLLFGLGPVAADDHPPNALCVIRADGTDLTTIIDSPDFKREFDWTDR
ncbi:MAG TPA: hypothetical protein VFK89_12180 [Actinomycetota bacterium]|nr:hypothetical protein [Actinomycetota bacterium]